MLSRVGPRPPVFRRQSSLPLPPRCEPFRARRSVTISESFEWLQSGSSPSVVSLPPSRSRSGSPRSGSLSPRSNRSDSLSKSFSPAAIDRLCEIVDGAKVKFLGTPVFSQGDKVIVSFPGAHGRAWNRLMQGAGGWKTSCVFAEQEYTRLWRPRHALFRPQSWEKLLLSHALWRPCWVGLPMVPNALWQTFMSIFPASSVLLQSNSAIPIQS